MLQPINHALRKPKTAAAAAAVVRPPLPQPSLPSATWHGLQPLLWDISTQQAKDVKCGGRQAARSPAGAAIGAPALAAAHTGVGSVAGSRENGPGAVARSGW